MSTEYRIGSTSKWSMIIIALIFDVIQFITPTAVDAAVIAIAVVVFTILFIEKGVLFKKKLVTTPSLQLWRIIAIISEVLLSFLPGITFTVVMQIAISRRQDMAAIKNITKTLGKHAYGKGKRGLATSKHKAKMLSKYAYGKGKRRVQALARKAQGE